MFNFLKNKQKPKAENLNNKYNCFTDFVFDKKYNEFRGDFFVEKFDQNCEVSFESDVSKIYAKKCIDYLKYIPDEIFTKICNLLISDFNYYKSMYPENDFPENITEKEIINYISDLSMLIYNHPQQDIIGFCLCGNCIWNEEHGFIIVINNDKVVHYGENDNIYYPWEFNNEKY